MKLKLRQISVRAVEVPMSIPLQTSTGAVKVAPFALIDLITDEGVTGSSYLFCYTPLVLKPIIELIKNLNDVLCEQIISPLELDRKLQGQFRLLGTKGLTAMASAGIDMAAWDALSKAQNLPLARMLGGDIREIPAYNSCGLGMIGPKEAALEAEKLLSPGFKAIKVRLGYPALKTDIEVVRAIKNAVGEGITLMADYNQALTVAEADLRIRALADEGLYWIEEPIQEDDYSGCAYIRKRSQVSLQIGENWWGHREMIKSLEAGASDLIMPDAMKIGGVTGWMRANALAESKGLPISSHGFPEISAHLLAVSSTCHWLEYVDWAEPILQEPLSITDGKACASSTPGSGITWNEENVARYLV